MTFQLHPRGWKRHSQLPVCCWCSRSFWQDFAPGGARRGLQRWNGFSLVCYRTCKISH